MNLKNIIRQIAIIPIIGFLIISCTSKKTNTEITQASADVNQEKINFEYDQGAIVRGNKESKEIALVFTGGKYADGGEHIMEVLENQDIKVSFFFTGNFYANADFYLLIEDLKEAGHYLGAHSDKHLLYCDWTKRDSLFVTQDVFTKDLEDNYTKMKHFGIKKKDAKYFLPPYEWYNDSISVWTSEMDLQLINMTRGTLSPADYTTPDMKSYRSSLEIYNSIISYEESHESGLNGFMLLTHIGTHPNRVDKFYEQLDVLIIALKEKGYSFKRVDELLSKN